MDKVYLKLTLAALFLAIFFLSILPVFIGIILLSLSTYIFGETSGSIIYKKGHKFAGMYINVVMVPILSIFFIYLDLVSVLFFITGASRVFEGASIISLLILTFKALSIRLNRKIDDYDHYRSFLNSNTHFANSLIPIILVMFTVNINYLVPITYAILFPEFLILAVTPFYYYVDSQSESAVKISSFVLANLSPYGLYLAVEGFFTGLYFMEKGSPYDYISLIIVAIIAILVVADLLVKSFRSISTVMDRNSLQVYEKFNKERAKTEILKVNTMGDSIKEFELKGRKENLLINISSFLSSAGFEYTDIVKLLAPVIEYKTPPSIILGIGDSNANLQKEIGKRKKIVDNLLRAITRSEKFYEQ